MIKLMIDRSKPIFSIFFLFSIFFSFGSNSKVFAEINQQLHLKTPSPLAPLFERPTTDLKYTNGQIDPGFQIMPKSFKRSVAIDSSGGYMVVEESILKQPFNMTYTIPLDEYINYAKDHNLDVYWNTQAKRYISGELQPRDSRGGGLTIEVPVKIKNRAFQQIFGGDRVSLTVTGNINIRGGFRHENRSEVRTAYTRGSDNNFKMEQTQQFQVTGNVGDKVTVKVDQNSERDFDFENTIKLTYTGYEDEIIQSIEAGNVSLSLPATQFVSFSATNSGLFGIKTVSTLGNLNLTTITSQEKGENKKISITGGATDETKQIQDYEFVKNKYFFLDEDYRNNYWPLTSEGLHTYDSNLSITEIEVYKSGTNYQGQGGVKRAWALEDSLIQKYILDKNSLTGDDTTGQDKMSYKGWFKRLEKTTDYTIDMDLGTLRLTQSLTEDEVLAVAYKYGQSNQTEVGDVDDPGKSTWIFKLIRPKNPLPADRTWKLMRRNIYSIGRNVPEDGFEATIYYRSSSGTDVSDGIRTDTEAKASYLTIFGLDMKDLSGNDTPDNTIDNNDNIFRTGSIGEIEFPFHEPFNPNKDDGTPVLLEDDKRCDFYNLNPTNTSDILKENHFYIEVNSKMRSATYQLGFNVIENSEEVTLNGARLQAGTDYMIDYMTGTLTMLREDATSASANIEINYQSNQFFQLEKKTLLGANLKYDISENRFINENSFIGGTFLYLNERTLDQKVRVGQGPMRNMIWDLNTKLSFKPSVLTTLVDALPLIETKAESRFDIEGEIAQVIPNPNTLNNENTGDYDGVAYIDDFEGANRTIPLGVMRRVWTLASCPEDTNIYSSGINSNRATKLGKIKWWNPYEQVSIKSIWPDRDVNANVAQTVNVLSVSFDPTQAIETDDPTTNWGGIMRSLSSGYYNQTESKFLEIWLKASTNTGMVHIDIGLISEDAIPNYSRNFGTYSPDLNTEDQMVSGVRNGLLDDGEDTGLDGMSGTSDWWDLNGDGVHQTESEPFSDDDWAYSSGSADYSKVNGTENNQNDTSGRYPDTEDINGNSSLDTQNEYFEYDLHLSPLEDDLADNYIQGGSNSLWRLYRIPLSDYKRKVGSPSMDDIEFVRIWIDGVADPITVQFAEVNIVGNQWLEKGIYEPTNSVSGDSLSYNYYESRVDTVIVTVVNTHDNADVYDPSSTGVTGVEDRITGVVAKEQSLVLRVDSTLPQNHEGIVQKTVSTAMDFIHYNKMKMFVHGGDGTTESRINFPNGDIEYFVRFGANETNYYEYRSNIFWGWDERNFMELDLNELSAMKKNIKDEDIRILEVTDEDDKTVQMEVKEDTIRFEDDSYHIWRVVNNPSLTNIRQITIGIKNCSDRVLGPDSVSTDSSNAIEVWFNEFRLSEVKKDKGTAMRMRFDLGLADLMSLNGQIEDREADFHTLSERFSSAGQNQVNKSLGGSLQVGKFFPVSWGVTIPISFNYTENTGTPKYLTGNDILYESLTDQIQKDAEVSYSQSQGWTIMLKKSSRSKNFLVKNTLDRISVNYSTRKSTAHNSSMKIQNGETHSGSASYSLDFGKRNYVEPFKWLGKNPIVNTLSQMKFYYLPTQISTSISGNLNKTFKETRSKDDLLAEGVKTNTRTMTLARQVQSSYKMFESLNFTFNRSWNNNFQNYLDGDETRSIKDILDGQFGTKTADNQTVSAKYNPNIVKWLTGNLSFNSNFRWANNIQYKTTGRSASTANTYTGNMTLDPNKMFRSLFRYNPSAKKTTRRTNKNDKDKKNDSGGPNFILAGVDKLTEKLQRISFNYNRRENQSYSGLMSPGDSTDLSLPSWKFRIFAKEDPGLEINDDLGQSASSFQYGQDYSLQTSLKIIQNMDLSLKYQHSDDKQESGNSITGNRSYNSIGSKPMPNWTFRWNGLEKLPLISKVAQRASLDHSYSGDFKEKWTTTRDNITSKTITSNYRPLIGMSLNLKKEIGVTFSYNNSKTESNTSSSGGTRRVNSDISVRANYSKRTGFRIPLPIWPFKNKEFKNNVDISVTFSSSSNLNYINRDGGDWVKQNSTEKWEFQPSVKYSFSNRVNGGAHFTVSKNKSDSIGETSLQEFAIDVNISIRGN